MFSNVAVIHRCSSMIKLVNSNASKRLAQTLQLFKFDAPPSRRHHAIDLQRMEAQLSGRAMNIRKQHRPALPVYPVGRIEV